MKNVIFFILIIFISLINASETWVPVRSELEGSPPEIDD